MKTDKQEKSQVSHLKTDKQITFSPNQDAEQLKEEKFKINHKPKRKKKKKKKSRLQKIEDPFNILVDDQIKETQAEKIKMSAHH